MSHSLAALRLPRTVHPIAWWLWAIGLATAASRTTNPLLLALVLAVAGTVVAARRTEAPWARAFKFYLLLGIAVIAIRVVFRIVLGGGAGREHVLFTIPQIPLPGFMSGVRIGGAVSGATCSPRATTASGSRRSCAASARPTRSPIPSARCASPGRALRARRHDHGRGHGRAATRRERAARAPGAQAARRHRARPARGARHRDAGAPRRARAVVPARGGDGLARLRTRGRRSRPRPAHHRRAAARRTARALPRYLRPARHDDPPAARRADARARFGALRRRTDPRRPARAPHELPARPVGVRGVGDRRRRDDRGDRDDRHRRAERVGAQPVGVPARVADAAAMPATLGILCALLPAVLTPPPPIAVAPPAPSATRRGSDSVAGPQPVGAHA